MRESIFKNAGEVLDDCKFINSYSDIFDRSVIDTTIGRCMVLRKSGKEAYKVTRIIKVYKDKVENVPLDAYDDKELVQLLSMRNCDPDMYSMLDHF